MGAVKEASKMVDVGTRLVLVLLGCAAFVALASAQTLESDDFNAGSLDPMWTFTDSLGSGSYTLQNGQLQLFFPEGQSHDNWTSCIVSPHLMQAVSDPDFDVDAQFEPTACGS